MRFTLHDVGVEYTLLDEHGSRQLVVKDDDGCDNWYGVPEWFALNDMRAFALGWSHAQHWNKVKGE